MEIIVKGRRTNIPEHFRQHAADKLAKIAKLDGKAIRVDVEVTKEPNPRQSDRRERVELTIRSRGPVIRAEAAADDRYTALDLALAKLDARVRKVGDRRKRHVDRQPARALAATPPPDVVAGDAAPSAAEPADGTAAGAAAERLVPIPAQGQGPLVVREKLHPASPMTIDQALLEMELVGHDFYLFHDSACDLFSVVYRRRGYDYGVIRLLEKQA